MAIVKTLKAVGQVLDRTARTVSEWKTQSWWPYPNGGPFDTDLIKARAIASGKFDRAGSDSAGIVTGTEAKTREDAKRREYATIVALKQREANLKLTNAKLAKTLVETQKAQRDLLPAELVHDFLMINAGELRMLGVQYRQKGFEAAANMLEDRLQRIAERGDELLEAYQEPDADL